jgi:hypothetical protein
MMLGRAPAAKDQGQTTNVQRRINDQIVMALETIPPRASACSLGIPCVIGP